MDHYEYRGTRVCELAEIDVPAAATALVEWMRHDLGPYRTVCSRCADRVWPELERQTGRIVEYRANVG